MYLQADRKTGGHVFTEHQYIIFNNLTWVHRMREPQSCVAAPECRNRLDRDYMFEKK
jgi:hypothetical protein